MQLKYSETTNASKIGDFTILKYDGITPYPVNSELLFT